MRWCGWAFLLLLVAGVAGCPTKHNPAYCSSNGDCVNGSVCDLDTHGCVPGSAIDGAVDSPSIDAAPGPRCSALPQECGASSHDDCCSTAVKIAGTSFTRSNDAATDGMFSGGAPATISDFYLDKYEVTVGRFREFVREGFGIQANAPAPTSGLHTAVTGSGWDSAWNSSLAANTDALKVALKCGSGQTWTDVQGANENLPINCVTWYEAFAFCIWDGGYLPTEAEWNFAAAGGSEQRAYPWSVPPGTLSLDCSFANYTTACTSSGGVFRVGTKSTPGDGRWQHADLAGNVAEFVLDWHRMATYTTVSPCNDCADVSPDTTFRGVRGGGFNAGSSNTRTGFRDYASPTQRDVHNGFRCGRKTP